MATEAGVSTRTIEFAKVAEEAGLGEYVRGGHISVRGAADIANAGLAPQVTSGALTLTEATEEVRALKPPTRTQVLTAERDEARAARSGLLDQIEELKERLAFLGQESAPSEAVREERFNAYREEIRVLHISVQGWQEKYRDLQGLTQRLTPRCSNGHTLERMYWRSAHGAFLCNRCPESLSWPENLQRMLAAAGRPPVTVIDPDEFIPDADGDLDPFDGTYDQNVPGTGPADGMDAFDDDGEDVLAPDMAEDTDPYDGDPEAHVPFGQERTIDGFEPGEWLLNEAGEYVIFQGRADDGGAAVGTEYGVGSVTSVPWDTLRRPEEVEYGAD